MNEDKHRTRIDIYREILIKTESPILKTELSYSCRIGYRPLNRYIDYLSGKNLIRLTKIGKVCRTERGKECLDLLIKLQGYI